jgi:hypothetical protein
MPRATRGLAEACVLCLVLSASAWADAKSPRSDPGHHHGPASRPDDHAPIGVMGEHLHREGEWMLSYRYGRMRMDGNRDGTDDRSRSDVLGQFLATPTDMDMEMHMFGLMFAPADWLTTMVMLPYVELTMDHVNRMGVNFTTESDGFGDLGVMGLFRLWDAEHHRLHLNAGISAPTGTLRNKDKTPVPMMGFQQVVLPYPMQIGSGTWDALPGLTYSGRSRELSWGGQALGTIRMQEENKADYRLGNRVDLTAWLARPWTKWLSTSLRVSWHWWGNIDGRDERIAAPTVIPTADPDRRAGNRLDLLAGVNLNVPIGPLGANRFAVEAGFPAYQQLDGPQLETDWRITVGWQRAFGPLWGE